MHSWMQLVNMIRFHQQNVISDYNLQRRKIHSAQRAQPQSTLSTDLSNWPALIFTSAPPTTLLLGRGSTQRRGTSHASFIFCRPSSMSENIHLCQQSTSLARLLIPGGHDFHIQSFQSLCITDVNFSHVTAGVKGSSSRRK